MRLSRTLGRTSAAFDDPNLVSSGGLVLGCVFARAYPPSTLGSFLRKLIFGRVRRLDAVASRFLIAPA